jgi:hypothetical protein
MKRRIIWSEGDSSPVYGHVTAGVTGGGTFGVSLGFEPSAVDVAFSIGFDEWLLVDDVPVQPEVYVSALTNTGFVVTYSNIPTNLKFNYIAL